MMQCREKTQFATVVPQAPGNDRPDYPPLLVVFVVTSRRTRRGADPTSRHDDGVGLKTSLARGEPRNARFGVAVVETDDEGPSLLADKNVGARGLLVWGSECRGQRRCAGDRRCEE